MQIAVACDHAGFPLKESILEAVIAAGHQPVDLGAHDASPIDYPDISRRVAEAILAGQAERGVLLCGSGVGACIAANKFPGIYASICHDTYSARQGVEHDQMNVLCLGARIVGPELARALVLVFLKARFTGEERHLRRVKKIQAIESAMREEH